jgi:predicted anti-sigma-YlaC factor YlaD
MDCKTVRSLLVPYLDGELAPAQVAWVDAHREGCASCNAAMARLSAQGRLLDSLPPPPMPPRLAAGLWARMDEALAGELHTLETAPAPQITVAAPPRNRLGRRALTLYAAVLGLALAFGLWRHDAASTAEARVQDLRMKLERAERLRASPSSLPSASGSYQTAAYVPGRGHL